MAELLSPGVFIEEVPATTQVVGPVSTSNMGIVSWTTQGPSNTATLVTSFDQYVKTFGSFDRRSFGAYSMAAFFSNGGRRAFVVRVTPADAIKAQAKVRSLTTGQLIETGDGATTTYAKTGATSVLKDNNGASPLLPGAFSLKYRAAQTAVVAENARKRDGNTLLTTLTGVASYEGRVDPKSTLTLGVGAAGIVFRSIQDARQDITITIVVAGLSTPLSVTVLGSAITINVQTDGAGLSLTTPNALIAAWPGFTAAAALVTPSALAAGTTVLAAAGTANLTGVPAFDESLDMVIPGTFSISWKAATVTKTVTVSGVTTPIATATNGAGSSVAIDLRTGRFSLNTVGAEIPVIADNAIPISVSYTPASTTHTITSDSTANAYGYMGLSGTTLTAGGTSTAGLTTPVPTSIQSWVNVNTGAYNLPFQVGATNIPHNKARLLATYTINAWTSNPISAGAWGNALSLQIQGSPNYFDIPTQTYSRFIVYVLQTDSLGQSVIQETYEDLVFDDATSAYYWADVVNEFSNLVTVVEPGGLEAPGQLQGLSNVMVVAAGDDADASRIITATLAGAPVAKRSLVITYTDSLGVARTIKDDGKGNLTGDIDVTYVGVTANTINYTTGALDFETVAVAGPLGVKYGTVVTATYRTVAAETAHLEAFGDTVKGYTVGTDGTFDTTNFGRGQFTDPTLQSTYQGLYALDRVDELMQVIVPDFAGDIVVTGDLLDYANSRAASSSGGDRFIILTVPKGSSATDAVDWFRSRLVRFSNFAALYWPWINVSDPLANGRKITMPGLGHVAGIYARTDVNRNVGKSPGGTVDGQLNFLIGLESVPTQGERDYVYPNKINPFISSAQTGNAVWGVRSIALDSQWKYINARRLFMFLEKSIYNSTFWIVFENNGPGLWARIKAQVQGFLLGLYNDQYFAGSTPDQAFFVICDETNNTAATIAAGQVIIDVGVAPNKPAEFVRFRFQQKTVG